MRIPVLAVGGLGIAAVLTGSVMALEVATGHWQPVAAVSHHRAGGEVPEPGESGGAVAETAEPAGSDTEGTVMDAEAGVPASPPAPPPSSDSGGQTEPEAAPGDPPPAPEGPGGSPAHPAGETEAPVEQARPVSTDELAMPVHSLQGGAPEVVLTFDDGPGRYTGQILSILQQERVPAAFFWLAGSEQVALAGEVQSQGHQLGTHTVGHVRLTDLAVEAQRAELARSIAILEQAGDVPVSYFRPPYGSYDVHTLEAAEDLGLSVILWNVDSRDWALADQPEQIITNVMQQVRPGSIILLHEREQTVQVLPDLVGALRGAGYTFRLLPLPEPEPAPAPAEEPAAPTPAADADPASDANPPSGANPPQHGNPASSDDLVPAEDGMESPDA